MDNSDNEMHGIYCTCGKLLARIDSNGDIEFRCKGCRGKFSYRWKKWKEQRQIDKDNKKE